MSSSESYGWKNKKVRHVDGRTGVISREEAWFGGVDLKITDAEGGVSIVKLHARGADAGEIGWHWWCPEFCAGPRWLPLGDKTSPLDADAASVAPL